MGPDEDDDATMILMKRMFGKDDRFVLGYCVPNSVRNDDIAKDIREAIRQYHVRAIKIHPNRTKIDLASRSGIERIFHILEASRDVKLPVIVHGGNSLTVQDEGTISYSSANNLQHIEWGITKEPVIIAHAGAFGHDVEEVANKIIPIMNKLLARYDNLLVDVAGLEMKSLGMVLNAIDVNKILYLIFAFVKNYFWLWLFGFLVLPKLFQNILQYDLTNMQKICKNSFYFIIVLSVIIPSLHEMLSIKDNQPFSPWWKERIYRN